MLRLFSLVAIICINSVIGQPECQQGMKLNFYGKILTTAITPYDDNGQLNLPLVAKLAKYYADNGLKNIFLMGFLGEGPSLSLKERKALLNAWLEQACLYGLKIAVEVGFQPFVDTLKFARYCSTKNVTAITHFSEQVYKAGTVEEALEDLRRIAQAAPNTPLIFNELLSTGPQISTDAVILMADQVPTLSGVETTINSYLDSEAVKTKCCKKLLTIIYDIQYMYAAYLLGLSTISLGPGLFPRTAIAMEAAADRCDRETAKQLQNKMNDWVVAITNPYRKPINTYTRSYFSNLKAAFEIITGIKVGARMPVDKTNSTIYEQIASNLRSLGVLTAESTSD